MNTQNYSQQALDYQRVAVAIRYVEENFQQQPTLDEIAASVHLSKHHFQRLFKQWAGISPTQFMQYLTLDYAKERLNDSHNVLETTLEAGLSSPGRLHDLFVNFEAVTPGEYKQRGAGLEISYGFQPTPFGTCLLAMTSRGICALRFVEPGRETAASTSSAQSVLAELKEEWPQAVWVENNAEIAPIVERIFSRGLGDEKRPFHLYLKGTNFQVQVWQALLAIPAGVLVSYGDVAQYLGKPTATRAVASAIARNPVGYFIPCHRVISQSGKLHNYRWGSTRKKAMVGWEAARTNNNQLITVNR
jgi:AraC family transcriptional regulator of adaptative response/methylated-DNA-[protein]-cysteine methyltransferase